MPPAVAIMQHESRQLGSGSQATLLPCAIASTQERKSFKPAQLITDCVSTWSLLSWSGRATLPVLSTLGCASAAVEKAAVVLRMALAAPADT